MWHDLHRVRGGGPCTVHIADGTAPAPPQDSRPLALHPRAGGLCTAGTTARAGNTAAFYPLLSRYIVVDLSALHYFVPCCTPAPALVAQ